jgi:hypothetical protein
MKGHSNFQGHKHTHAEKLAIAFSQEGHRNAAGLSWSINKNTGKETRTKNKLPKGNRWGRTSSFQKWIHNTNEMALDSSQRLVGTNSLADTYIKDTPGQTKPLPFSTWMKIGKQ